jgi:acyl carrier protein
MTVRPAEPGLVPQRVLAEVTGLLVAATGEDEQWAAAITPASRLEGDLRVESFELTALGALLQDHYGDQVDLSEFVASLDIDQLIDLSVGDLVGYVAVRMRPSAAGAPG